MDIKDRVGKIEGLDDEAKQGLIDSLNEVIEKANKERDQAVHSRNSARDSEKALKSELSELKTQLEEIQAKDMSEAEKAAKELEKITKQVQELTAERESLTGELAKTKRDNAIGRIHEGLKWNRDLVPADDSLAHMERILDGVDLDDEAAVKGKVDEFVSGRPHYFRADAKGGVGSHNDGGHNGGGDGGSINLDKVNVLDKDELRNALAATMPVQ